MKSVIFDFDNTLYDSSKMEDARSSGNWQAVYQIIGECPFYPGVIDVVNALRDRNIMVAIASNAPRVYIMKVLKHYRLTVDFIIAYHDVTNHKPNPEAIQIILNKYRLLPNDVIFIGDNDIDFYTARNAKVPFAGVEWGDFSREPLVKINFNNFIEKIVFKHYLWNKKNVHKEKPPEEIVQSEENVYFLGYYISKGNDIAYESVTSKLLEFKNNNPIAIRQWNTVVKHSAVALPKADIVVRALGHKETTAEPNRIDSIGKEIAKTMNAKYRPELLVKGKTQKSTKLRAKDRKRNIYGKYTVIQKNKLKQLVNSILIIDDVYTTGATTDEIARALRESFGNIDISVFTLLRTKSSGARPELKSKNLRLFEMLETSESIIKDEYSARISNPLFNKYYSANYSFTNHNFVIQNVPNQSLKSKSDGKQLLSAVFILKNILQRGKPTLLSKYLQKELGAIHLEDDFKKPVPLIDNSNLEWNRIIKGATNPNKNIAKKFYDTLIPQYLGDYAFVKNLIIPEVNIYEITQIFDESLQGQQVDFYLPQGFLIIEIDGIHHESHLDNDEYRDRHTHNYGIKTVRFTADEVRIENSSFVEKINDIKDHLDRVKEQDMLRKQVNQQVITLSDYQKQFFNREYTPTNILLSTAIIRFQLTVLELIENQCLTLDNNWIFQLRLHDVNNFAELAINDIFLWFENLFFLLNIDTNLPKYKIIYVPKNKNFKSIKNSYKIDFSLFQRFTDEFQDNPDIIYVRTHYLDYFKHFEIGSSLKQRTIEFREYDYFTISTLKRINYSYNSIEAFKFKKCILFLLENIFFSGIKNLEFREGQFEVISNALIGNDTIGLLPTGSGKSVCYQLAAILQPCINFVVCPIKSLMYDQKYDLDSIYISRSNYVSGDLSSGEKEFVQTQFSLGKYFFIFISPERFQTKTFRQYLTLINEEYSFGYAVIDEVHCLSEWGHDFRTSYLSLSTTINRHCTDIRYIGLTATASINVLRDIQKEFDIEDLDIKTPAKYTRDELSFNVINDNGNKYNALLSQLREMNDRFGILEQNSDHSKCGIIFTPFVNGKKGCYQLASNLSRDLNMVVKFYSGSKPKLYNGVSFDDYKKDTQIGFKNNEFTLLTATKAFGMGVNKGNIYYTYHYGLPSSMESLYQEAGRAGRDKTLFVDHPAECIVVLTPELHNNLENLWDPKIGIDELSTEVKRTRYDGDINSNFFLFLNGLLKINEESIIIKSIYNYYYRPDSLTQIIDTSKVGGNKAHVEKAIFRLTQLGIVRGWTVEDFFRGIYEVEFIKHEPNDVKYALTRTIQKYDKEFSLETLKESDSERYQYVFQMIKSEIQVCYLILLIWSYEHFAYNRRQSIKNVYENSLNLASGKITKGAFKKSLEDYFTYDIGTDYLQVVADHPMDYTLWFKIFFKVYDGQPTNELCNLNRLLQIKGQLSRFLESYMNNSGLNIISGMLRLLLNDYDDTDGRARMESAIEKIIPLQEQEKNHIYNVLAEFSGNLDEYNTERLISSIFKITRDKLFLQHFYAKTNNTYAAHMYIIEQNTRLIRFNEIVGELEW